MKTIRPIDAEALKEAFGERPLNWNDTPEEIQSVNDWDNAMMLIDAAPTITISNKWISVKDGRPKKDMIAKQACVEDYEHKRLIMSDNKCKQCEYYYRCSFIMMEMNAVINGE